MAPAPKGTVYVIYDKNDVIEVQDTKAHAEAAIGKYKSSGLNAQLKKVEIKQGVEAEEDDEAAAEAEAPKKKKKSAAAAKKSVPDRSSDSLDGLKLLFTGTMSRNRKDFEAIAVKNGAEIVTAAKIGDADYVVLGTKPGDKKLEAIEQHGLVTIDEDQFVEMVEGGGPAKKKQKT